MRKSYFLTMVLIIVSSSLFSQSDFREGYIVSNSGDTIFGFIDYRGDYLNCNKCVFKESLNEKTVTYFPNEIKSYRFSESKFYVSYFVENLNKYVFLEYLIDGIVDVYFYKDINDKYYYIDKEGEKIQLLENKEIEVMIDGQAYIRNSNRHIGLLNYYLNESEEIKKRINDVELEHKSLIKLTKDYHDFVCSGEECIIFEKRLPSLRFEAGALVFANYSDFNIDNTNYGTWGIYDEKKDLSHNLGYEFGFSGSLYFPKFNERISLYLQLLYGANSFEFNSIEDEILYTRTTTEKYYIWSFTKDIGFKYKFPKGKLRPEFIIGYTSVRVNAKNKSKVTGEEVDYNGDVDVINYDLDYPDNVPLKGIFFGAGLNFFQLGKLDFNINLQYNYHFSNLPSASEIKMNNIRFGLGITY